MSGDTAVLFVAVALAAIAMFSAAKSTQRADDAKAQLREVQRREVALSGRLRLVERFLSGQKKNITHLNRRVGRLERSDGERAFPPSGERPGTPPNENGGLKSHHG